jgi:hypothetical protein
MKYEENILKYLDGSLTDSESAELLHALSVSPEKRVILEQHLQLKDMVTSAQKPFTVPAELEQAMSRKFPVIPMYTNELMVGANLAERSVITSFFARRSVRVGAAAILLLAFTSYLAVSSRNGSSVTEGSKAIGASVTSAPTMSGSSNDVVSGKSSNNTSTSVNVVEPSKTIAKNVQNTHTTVRTNNVGSNLQTNTSRPEKDIAIVDHNTVNVDEANHAISIDANSTDASLPVELALISSISTPRSEASASIARNSIGEPRYITPFGKKYDQLQVPVLLRFEYGMGQAYFRVNTTDAVQNTRIESAPLFGVDYVASPYFSLGLEGGSAGIAQVVPSEVYEGTSNVTRYVTSNTIEASNHFYTRLMARYTINPYDMFHIETGIGGGVAFDEKAVPLVAATAALSYDLSQKLSMSFGASFAGTFSKVAAPVQSGETPTNNEAMPIGYIEENTPSSTTLFSPSLTFRFGLRIKPW